MSFTSEGKKTKWNYNKLTIFGGVTIDGVGIGEWIIWPIIYTTWNYTLKITDTHSP
jgi:hypothetical protein